ncbi:hypothetical protein HIM_01910 [Hirsutella minnesotensis 3608]|nr:hypothetical protein HIM_01910 [Hirsutella minnesotensis 3608]
MLIFHAAALALLCASTASALPNEKRDLTAEDRINGAQACANELRRSTDCKDSRKMHDCFNKRGVKELDDMLTYAVDWRDGRCWYSGTITASGKAIPFDVRTTVPVSEEWLRAAQNCVNKARSGAQCKNNPINRCFKDSGIKSPSANGIIELGTWMNGNGKCNAKAKLVGWFDEFTVTSA